MFSFKSDQTLCYIPSNVRYNLPVPAVCKNTSRSLAKDEAAEIDTQDNRSAMYISLPRFLLYLQVILYFLGAFFEVSWMLARSDFLNITY